MHASKVPEPSCGCRGSVRGVSSRARETILGDIDVATFMGDATAAWRVAARSSIVPEAETEITGQ